MKTFSGEPDLQAGKPALRSGPPEKAAVVSGNKTPVAQWANFTPRHGPFLLCD